MREISAVSPSSSWPLGCIIGLNPSIHFGMEMVELIAEDDKVVARIKGTVTGKYGPYNNTYCHVFTVRDGKIVENIEHLDTALIETALYGKKLAA